MQAGGSRALALQFTDRYFSVLIDISDKYKQWLRGLKGSSAESMAVK